MPRWGSGPQLHSPQILTYQYIPEWQHRPGMLAKDWGMAPSASTGQEPTMVSCGIISYSHQAAPHCPWVSSSVSLPSAHMLLFLTWQGKSWNWDQQQVKRNWWTGCCVLPCRDQKRSSNGFQCPLCTPRGWPWSKLTPIQSKACNKRQAGMLRIENINSNTVLFWYLVNIARHHYGSFIDWNPYLKIEGHGKDYPMVIKVKASSSSSLQGSLGLMAPRKNNTLEGKAMKALFRPTLRCLWWVWLCYWQMYFMSTMNKNLFLVCCLGCLYKTSCWRNRKQVIPLYTLSNGFLKEKKKKTISKTSWMLQNKSDQWCSFLLYIKLYSHCFVVTLYWAPNIIILREILTSSNGGGGFA